MERACAGAIFQEEELSDRYSSLFPKFQHSPTIQHPKIYSEDFLRRNP